jgi:transcriptional regulator with XRE-family HTH domain
MDAVKIGKFILSLRKENNLSQSQFAEKLNVTSQAVSKWENGRGIPDIEILKKISDEFDVDICEIINGTKNKKKKNKPFIIFLGITLLIFATLFMYICFFKHRDNLELATIASSKNTFNITGILVSNKDKTNIYISNIKFKDEDESKYVAVECVLYEQIKNNNKLISKYGNLDKIKSPKEMKPFSLGELLTHASFNTGYYSDKCKELSHHNFYIAINALESSGKVVAYKIPLRLIESCQKKI